MNKQQKQDLISQIKNLLQKNNVISLIHYRGLNDKQLFDLRLSLKNSGCGIKVVKNTLLRIAVKDLNFDSLKEYLKGPTALVYSNEPVSLAKIIYNSSKESEHLKIQAFLFDNKLLEENDIKSLASLGSLDEVRSSFIMKLNAVQSNFVRILAAPNSGEASNFSN
jgi:large subunit ribosomal protein L10